MMEKKPGFRSTFTSLITEGCVTVGKHSQGWLHHYAMVTTPTPLFIAGMHVLGGLGDKQHPQLHTYGPSSHVAHSQIYQAARSPLRQVKKLVKDSRASSRLIRSQFFPQLTRRVSLRRPVGEHTLRLQLHIRMLLSHKTHT